MPDDGDQKRRLRLAASDGSPYSAPERPLKSGDQRGTSDTMDQELVNAKIAAAEARTDTKFAQLLARLDSMDGKLGRIESENIRTRQTVRTTGFTIVSIIVAVLGLLFAVFSQSFNLGTKVSDAARAEAISVYDSRQALPTPAATPRVIENPPQRPVATATSASR